MTRKASEVLVQTTRLANDPLFAGHDSLTKVNLDKVWVLAEDGHYSIDEMTLISVFEFLTGADDSFVTVSDIAALPGDERTAVLDALKAHWNGLHLEENL